MSALRVVFSGAKGRMGRVLVPGLEAAPDIEVVAATDVGDDLPAVLDRLRPDIVVDFTTPQAAMPNARAIVAGGAQGVIGTTGFGARDLDALDDLARAAGRGVLVAPNFALGMVLLQRFAEEAARHFPRAEIVETHHEGKADAPSGTALRTAQRMSAAGAVAGPSSDGAPSRGLGSGGVRIHSRRLPGIQAHQEVLLASSSETLVLAHQALSRDCYLAGVLAAVRAVPGRTGLLRGLDAILFDPGPSPPAREAPTSPHGQ